MATLTLVPAGAAMPDVQPGDFVLTHGHNLVDRLIRVGQWLKFVLWPLLLRRPRNRWACWTNHAAGIVDADGTLVEMLARGATVSPWSKYERRNRIVVHTGLDDVRQAEAVAYWQWLATTHVAYGWVSIALDGLALLTHLPIGGAYHGRPVCSAAVAAGLGLPEWRACPASVTPADLAFRFNARPPRASTGRQPVRRS